MKSRLLLPRTHTFAKVELGAFSSASTMVYTNAFNLTRITVLFFCSGHFFLALLSVPILKHGRSHVMQNADTWDSQEGFHGHPKRAP